VTSARLGHARFKHLFARAPPELGFVIHVPDTKKVKVYKMNVVKRYQHSGLNSKINPMLRGERPHTNKYNKNIQNLNTLMKSGKAVNLYRGIVLSGNVPKVLKSRAFTSASTNINVAKEFGNKIIFFTLPPHIKRHHIINAHNYEFETLIQRNTQFTNFKLLRTNKDGKKIYSAKIEFLKNVPQLKNRLRNLKRNSNNESSNFEN